jgi:23S rRNA pseudouridine1911/1915/1917 synthase
MPEWIAETAQRLDAYLAADGRMLSRAKAQKAIEDGKVRVNGKKTTKMAYRLELGDTVALKDEEETEKRVSTIVPKDLKLEILHEDDTCFVLLKPAGIAVHPGAGMEPGEITLLSGIAHLYKKRKLPFGADSVLVHRLDKETTGCILVAKNPKAHLALQKQFESRTVKKLYLALVAGVPALPMAKIDSPIGRSVVDRTKMSVRAASGMREAQTTYRVVAEGKRLALVECDLHTGRTHQVRVHLTSIGHPVLGDPGYASPLSRELADAYGIKNLCLHAWKLSFRSPADDKTHDITAALPAPFVAALEATEIGWEA